MTSQTIAAQTVGIGGEGRNRTVFLYQIAKKIAVLLGNSKEIRRNLSQFFTALSALSLTVAVVDLMIARALDFHGADSIAFELGWGTDCAPAKQPQFIAVVGF